MKTYKRDQVRVNPRPDAISGLQRPAEWFEDYNNFPPTAACGCVRPVNSSPRRQQPKPLIRFDGGNSMRVFLHQPRQNSWTARFTLRGASLVDRWRGGVSRTVPLRLEQHRAAREVLLPDTDLHVPGRVDPQLPEDADPSGALILLRHPDTVTDVEIVPGGSGGLEGARVTAQIAYHRLVLETAPE